MTSLAKSVQPPDSFPQSKTLKPPLKAQNLAFSPGLEAIYTIETIDLKSVRKLSQPVSSSSVESKTVSSSEYKEADYSFDLGPFYRGWMPPWISLEPIQVLEIVKHVEKIFLDRGISTLGELEKVNFHDMSLLKGLGQGHIDDVQRKLKNYLSGKSKQKTDLIDYLSLIKVLFGSIDRKKAYVTLELYELSDWLSLTPMEKMEVKKLTLEQRHDWISETINSLFSDKKKEFICSQFRLLTETWIKPWLFQRGGFATLDQIEESLILRSVEDKVGSQTLLFLMKYFSLELPSFEGIFAATDELKSKFEKIVTYANSYFTLPATEFALTELAYLVFSECALEWSHITLEEVTSALKLSQRFNLYRNHSGKWFIYRPLAIRKTQASH